MEADLTVDERKTAGCGRGAGRIVTGIVPFDGDPDPTGDPAPGPGPAMGRSAPGAVPAAAGRRSAGSRSGRRDRTTAGQRAGRPARAAGFREGENRAPEDDRRRRETDALKSEFLSMAAHELRTPLTIIKEYVGILRDGLAVPPHPDQVEFLDAAFRNCDRLANLIDDILDLQVIESGRLFLRRRRVDLRAVLDRCRRDFLPRFRAKSQTLVLEGAGEPLEVLADEAKVIQVVVNVVGNAHKFTPPGGTVTIRGFRRDGEAVVDVEDDGPGIHPEDQRLIFEKFGRLGGEDGSAPRGTGLGLSIARSILALHGGRIELRSEVGKGSTFSCSLPLYREEDELRVRLEDRLEETRRQRRSLRLILLRPEGDARAGGPGGEQVLSRIAAGASRACRRPDDEVVTIPREMMVAILTPAGALGPPAIVARLLRALREEGLAGIRVAHSAVRVLHDGRSDHWIARAKARLAGPVLPFEGRSVLLVRSSPAGTEDLREELVRSLPGIRLAVARTVCDGFILLGRLRPELIVIDVAPPACGCRKVLGEIRGFSGGGGRPRVLAVAEGDAEAGDLEKLGTDACVTRPLDPSALAREAKRLLEGKAR